MSLYPHPHTVEDAGGNTITFVREISDDGGERVQVKNRVQPGDGPPMHVHHLQEEVLRVDAGELSYQVAGEEPRTAGPGDVVRFPAGIAHRFWNSGDDELLCSGHISPPLNAEYFLTQIYDSSRRNGKGRPGGFDAAWLLRRYRSEFAITEIPAPVQRFVFPIQVAIGRLRGQHRRFDGAPEPVQS